MVQDTAVRATQVQGSPGGGAGRAEAEGLAARQASRE